jgi:NADPH:quinone reductase-like Zn-dependent oxidoreductase
MRTPDTVTALEVVLPGIVAPEGLQLRRRTLPPVGPGQARVAVEASGVSAAERAMRRGKYYGQPKFPFVPGYDLVGTATRVGAGVDPGLVGGRYAAVTKVGGWASDVILDAADLVRVPDGVDSIGAEAVLVNGITAWQMLHRSAQIKPGQTVLVLGATGGVGSVLVQLARLAGARVIGTASARNQDAVVALGAIPIDYAAPDMAAQVKALAPDGVDAVFDHIGGPGLSTSFGLLAAHGTLVSYSAASSMEEPGTFLVPVLKIMAKLFWWNTLPNRRSAVFYDLWKGQGNPDFRTRLRTDLGSVLDLLAQGKLSPRIAARIPLSEAARALALLESHTSTGKIVLVP